MSRLKLPAAGQVKPVSDLPAAAAAAVLGGLAAGRCVLAVLADEASARRLHRQAGILGQPSWLIAGWEMLPYDVASPPRSAVCARSAALSCLRQGQPGLYAVSAASLMLPAPPPAGFQIGGISLAVGQRADMAELQERFLAAGCVAVERVRTAGEFAVCGGQIDVYPAGSSRPCRLVFEDDCIGQIRFFDPATQRSSARVDSFDLLAARDYALDESSIRSFRRAWRESIDPAADERIYEDISAGREAEGVEFLLPLFFGGRYSALDYLRPVDAIWIGRGVDKALEEFAQLVDERHDEARRAGRPALAPERVFAGRSHLEAACAAHPAFRHDPRGDDCGYEALPDIAIRAARRRPHARLARWLEGFSGAVVLAVHDFTRRAEIDAALDTIGRKATPIDSPAAAAGKSGLYICDQPLAGGFVDRRAGLALVTETELYSWQHDQPSPAAAAAAALEELMELSPGDLVVTPQHGVGRFLGLRTLGRRAAQPGVHLHRVRRGCAAVRCGRELSRGQPLSAAGSGRAGAARQTRWPALGAGAAGGRWRQPGTRPPRCWKSTVAGPRPRRPAADCDRRCCLCRLLRPLPASGDCLPDPDLRRGARGSRFPAADGPPAVRGRRIRQDRGRDAGRLGGLERGPAGDHAGADRAAGRAALPIL